MPLADRSSAPGDPHYSETAAIVAVASDLDRELGFRLARRPSAGVATLWARSHFGGQTLSVSEATDLAAGPTRFDRRTVLYDERGGFELRLQRGAAGSAPLTARAHLAARAQLTADPVPGDGRVPFLADLQFTGFHPPVGARAGRIEVFGWVEARVQTDAGAYSISAPGKLHEQRGPRERFGLAFSYLWLAGRDVGLLAVDHDAGAYGFAWADGAMTPVRAARIDPPGGPRRFQAELEDGRRIGGVAEVVRVGSDEVEGQRRPSATVFAQTDLGPLVGHLNDWRPAP